MSFAYNVDQKCLDEISGIIATMGEPLKNGDIRKLLPAAVLPESVRDNDKRLVVFISAALKKLVSEGKVEYSTTTKGYTSKLKKPAVKKVIEIVPEAKSSLPDQITIEGIVYRTSAGFDQAVEEAVQKRLAATDSHTVKLRRIGDIRTMSNDFTSLEFDKFESEFKPGQLIRISISE